MNVIPTGETLGATIDGVDLSNPLSDEQFDAIVHALGHHAVLRFPEQKLSGQVAASHCSSR